jgi:hypothetical protein
MCVFGLTGADPVVERVASQIWSLLGTRSRQTGETLLDAILMIRSWPFGTALLGEAFRDRRA